MFYVLAILFPPLVPLFKLKLGHLLLNLLLCLFFYLPAIVHAFWLAQRDYADRRDARFIRAIAETNSMK